MAILDKIEIDFQIINTNDPKKLSIYDTSVWGAIENKVAAIEITIPGSEKPRRYTHLKNQISTFNTSNLSITEIGVISDLPDGMYSIALIGANKNCKHRKYLKMDKLRINLAKLYLKLNFDSKGEKQVLLDIHSLIKSAELLTLIGEVDRAMIQYKDAVSKVNSIEKCKTCN